ncbi:MAG TPA: hypothetical protein VH253_16270 [Phycisphaerae bacterium]|nr:hypothetical protein [Phycisphaerae bacterium]
MKNGKKGGGFEASIWELKRKEPFAPFKIVTAGGDKYLIDDPEMMVVGPTEIIYVVPRDEKVIYIRKSQIVALEQFHKKSVA